MSKNFDKKMGAAAALFLSGCSVVATAQAVHTQVGGKREDLLNNGWLTSGRRDHSGDFPVLERRALSPLAMNRAAELVLSIALGSDVRDMSEEDGNKPVTVVAGLALKRLADSAAFRAALMGDGRIVVDYIPTVYAKSGLSDARGASSWAERIASGEAISASQVLRERRQALEAEMEAARVAALAALEAEMAEAIAAERDAKDAAKK